MSHVRRIDNGGGHNIEHCHLVIIVAIKALQDILNRWSWDGGISFPFPLVSVLNEPTAAQCTSPERKLMRSFRMNAKCWNCSTSQLRSFYIEMRLHIRPHQWGLPCAALPSSDHSINRLRYFQAGQQIIPSHPITRRQSWTYLQSSSQWFPFCLLLL